MGLSIEELELQSTAYLPAREVMSAMGGGHGGSGSPGNYADNDPDTGGLIGDLDVQQVNVLGVQNVLQFTGDDSDLIDAFNGNDSDVVDIG
jgi:hypothetical protein